MVFDFMCGAGYDAMDIIGPAADSPAIAEKLWYALLNQGYRITATAGGSDTLGDFRNFILVADSSDLLGAVVGAIKAGTCVASSGPMALCECESKNALGQEFAADGSPRRMTISAWAGNSDTCLHSVQIVRNGEVVHVWYLEKQQLSFWQGTYDFCDTGFAWYVVRAVSFPKGSSGLQDCPALAVTSPIYFLPPGFERPQPVVAKYRLRVTDTADRNISCKVIARRAGYADIEMELPDGVNMIELPAGAILFITAPGFVTEKRSALCDTPIGAYCRDLGMARLACDAPQVWREMQAQLSNIDITVRLLRTYDYY
jgi:hypothetical protein